MTNHIPDQNQVPIPVPKIVTGPSFPSTEPGGKWVNCTENCVPCSELKTNRFSETLKVVRIYAGQGITSSVISEELHGAWRLGAVTSDAFAPCCSVRGAEPHLQCRVSFLFCVVLSTHGHIATQGKARHTQWEKVRLLRL